MRTHTHLDKITVALAVAAFAVAPAALAAPRDGRSPDTRDAALTAQQHLAAPADGRSPDTAAHAPALRRRRRTRDASSQRAPHRSRRPTLPGHDRRRPRNTSPHVTVIHSPGFQWSDFGIGAAAAFSAMLILALSIRLLAARQNRKQPSPVATA